MQVGEMIIDQSFFGEVNDKGDGIKQDKRMVHRRQGDQGIDNWRGIENDHQHDIPNHREIPKFHIQWRCQQGK